MLKTLFITFLCLAAAAFSLFMLFISGPQIAGVFRLTDPTGLFGGIFTLGGAVADGCVIFLSAIIAARIVEARRLAVETPLTFIAVFILKLTEAAGLLPCLAHEPGALCGVGGIAIAYLTSPVICILTLRMVLRTPSKKIRRAGAMAALLCVLAGAAAWWWLTPKSPTECGYIPQISGRGACLEKFALKSRDMSICKQIDFRPFRYECQRLVAEDLQRPELCAEIQTPEGAMVASYETPASDVRDLCYYSLAFDLRSREPCFKMDGYDLRKICLDKAAPPEDKK